MKLTDITAAISESEGIPRKKVRQVSKALLDRIALAIENGEALQLPGLRFRPRTQPAKPAEGDKPAKPERKMAVIRVRKPKS